MKHILITGADSYIGTSLEAHLKDGPYTVTTLDVREPDWQETSFAGFDAVLHVAAIVHQKEQPEMEELYFRVNRDLALSCARKAKAEGVGQFLLMSSMSVYGMDAGVITPDTAPRPVSFYGKSKLEAEELIRKEADEKFRVCILRPPMVYGNGCKGNFQTVVKLVKLSPVFPRLRNQRSMICIENLCEFLRLAIDEGFSGLFFPQNREYMQTSHMARTIADKLGKRVFFSRLAGLAVRMLIPFLPMAKKAFGSLIYQGTEQHDYRYCIRDNAGSVADSVS